MVLRPCLVALAVLCVSSVLAQTPVGGDNVGIFVAQPPIPFDKCSISAANDADFRLTAVAWGYDNSYWMIKQGEDWGPWGEWKSLGGYFSGGPTVIRNANNDLAIFGRGTDRKVWYKTINDNDGEWVPIGGKLLTGRVSAVLDSQGLIHVFARGKDSAVWEKRQYANGTEAIWGEWVSLGGIVTSNVAVINDPEGVLHLFARGVEGSLWTMTQKVEDDGSLTWVAWVKSDNSVYLSSSATITAQLNAQGLIEVIARGADKAMWHTRQTENDERGVVWSPWKSLSGIFSSAPSTTINHEYLLTTFGRGPEKGFWYKQQAHHPVDSPADVWSKWVPLGGRFSTGADTALDSRGYVNVFGRGLDRGIWHRGQMYSNKTVGFFGPWTNMAGRFRSFAC